MDRAWASWSSWSECPSCHNNNNTNLEVNGPSVVNDGSRATILTGANDAEMCRFYCDTKHSSARFFIWFWESEKWSGSCWCLSSYSEQKPSQGVVSGEVSCNVPKGQRQRKRVCAGEPLNGGMPCHHPEDMEMEDCNVCPIGYSLKIGFGSGNVTWHFSQALNRNDRIHDCSALCDNDGSCCSFAYSTTTRICNLYASCKPPEPKYEDYDWCSKDLDGKFYAVLTKIIGVN